MMTLVFAGFGIAKMDAAEPKPAPTINFTNVLVTVQDDAGKPIEGATILPDGFRVKGAHSADAYIWNRRLFGAPRSAVTDQEGKALLRYPVEGIPEEKEFTGALTFSVTHPEFSTARVQTYLVNGTEQPIELTRGLLLELSGYIGTNRQPVLDLIPNLSQEGLKETDWQTKTNGVLAYHKLSPGGHLVQLMGRLPSGELVYSEGFDFVAEKGKKYDFALEMKPGIRLEGNLDKNVPRPVKHGRVLISVRPKQFPAYLIPEVAGDLHEKYGYFRYWNSYRPIAEDGTFTFESIPPGEVDVAVHGEGFVSKSIGEVQNRIPVTRFSSEKKLVKSAVIGIPQPFPLVAPTTKIEVVTEPSATVQVIAKTKAGGPVAGATLYLNPNILRMGGFFGVPRRNPSEEQFHPLEPLPELSYSAITDKNGLAIVRNVPSISRDLSLEHPDYEVALQGWMQDRFVRFSLVPGETKKIELTLQPKGKQFIGKTK